MSQESSLAPLNVARITIILVRPQSPGNIGAVARAMHNMGLAQLTLVAPVLFPHPEADMMACHAEAVLQQARVCDTLHEAIASCHWLVGTSARRRHYRKPSLTPRELADKLPALCQQYHVGVLFGPEDSGLTTEELNRCHERVVIPTVPTATSLNLAQAVMVLCYEMLLARYHPTAPPALTLATVADVEAMYNHLREAFAIRGFPDAYSVKRILDRLRRIFERTGLEQRDVRLIRGIARQLAWALRHPATERHEQEP